MRLCACCWCLNFKSYDFETRGVAKLLQCHANKPVVAVSWNASSHHLLSASIDGDLIRWNVLAGTQVSAADLATLPGPKRRVKRIQMHPTIESVRHHHMQ